ncbi:MAG TPA: hypothetical protein VMD30_12075 [Tepidisphaeraceae bacterium]|nr:hypothetical protein [Tepidisphaeraceae bacterium]
MSDLRRNWIIFILIVAAAAVRLAGIDCQLWLDEIWSITWAQSCKTPWDIFTIHHDNNHWLNTLWLYFLGAGRPWWVYHVPAEICGIGTVIVGWLIARRRGWWEGLATVILLGGSEFLVEFSSEARGYAPAGFFAILCVSLLDANRAAPRRWKVAAMAAGAGLGILSHLTFIVVLAGLIAASGLMLIRQRHWVDGVVRIVLWWAVPVGLLAALYFVDVRMMHRGGGPPTPADLPSEAAGMILGIPLGSVAAPIFGIVAMVLCVLRIVRLWRAKDPLWIIGTAAVLYVPAVLYLWPRSDYLHPRYLFVVTPVLMLLLGLELGKWLASRRLSVVAAAMLGGFVVINAITVCPFLRLGRGQYLQAVEYMVHHTSTAEMSVNSLDHSSATLMVVDYYDEYNLHGIRRLTSGDQPQWAIADQTADSSAVRWLRKGGYRAVMFFPKGSVTSGESWTIYEKRGNSQKVSGLQ